MEGLIYKTKCRVCGSIHEWYFGESNLENWKNLHIFYVCEHLSFPIVSRCDKCEEVHAVQDVISYSPKPHKDK